MVFKKGESGNPSGRPAIVKTIQELARLHSDEAFNEIVRLSANSEDERVRFAACNAILDRAFGKPAQAVEVSGDKNSPFMVMVAPYAK